MLDCPFAGSQNFLGWVFNSNGILLASKSLCKNWRLFLPISQHLSFLTLKLSSNIWIVYLLILVRIWVLIEFSMIEISKPRVRPSKYLFTIELLCIWDYLFISVFGFFEEYWSSHYLNTANEINKILLIKHKIHCILAPILEETTQFLQPKWLDTCY